MNGWRVSYWEKQDYTMLKVWIPVGEHNVWEEVSKIPVMNRHKGVVLTGNLGLVDIVNIVEIIPRSHPFLAIDRYQKGYICLFSSDSRYKVGSSVAR